MPVLRPRVGTVGAMDRDWQDRMAATLRRVPAPVWLAVRVLVAPAALAALAVVYGFAGCHGSTGFCSGTKAGDAAPSVAAAAAVAAAACGLVVTRRWPVLLVLAVAGAAVGGVAGAAA